MNLFHGRIHRGRVHIGNTEFPISAAPDQTEAPAVAYVRPHDIRVSRTPDERATLPARVLRLHAAGPIAHIELARLDDQTHFAVQLSRDEFRQLAPRPGEQLFVELQCVRVFADDYSI